VCPRGHKDNPPITCGAGCLQQRGKKLKGQQKVAQVIYLGGVGKEEFMKAESRSYTAI